MTITLDPPAPAVATPDPECSVLRDVRAALDVLVQLGHPDRIAAHLARGGHVGEPGCRTACVLAQYLAAAVPAVLAVGVSGTEIQVYGCGNPNGLREIRDVPDVVRDFIDRFDREAYPDLVYRPEQP